MAGFNLTENFGQGGNKPWDWRGRTHGAAAEGEVLDTRAQQARKFMGPGKPPGDPEKWDDGNPKMQLVVTLQTNERDPQDSEDSGVRDVYLNTWGDTFRNVQKAMRPFGGVIEDGGHVRIPWLSGAGVSGDGRVLGFEYSPPAKGVNVSAIAPQEPAQAAPAPAPTPAAPVMEKAPEVPTPAAPAATNPTAGSAAPAEPRKTFTAAQVAEFASMGILASLGQFDIVG